MYSKNKRRPRTQPPSRSPDWAWSGCVAECGKNDYLHATECLTHPQPDYAAFEVATAFCAKRLPNFAFPTRRALTPDTRVHRLTLRQSCCQRRQGWCVMQRKATRPIHSPNATKFQGIQHCFRKFRTYSPPGPCAAINQLINVNIPDGS